MPILARAFIVLCIPVVLLRRPRPINLRMVKDLPRVLGFLHSIEMLAAVV